MSKAQDKKYELIFKICLGLLLLAFFVIFNYWLQKEFNELLRINTASISGSGSATYYIDNASGSDSNSGTSPGQAWKTISKVNNSNFQPGDQILFKRGGIWQEQLAVSSSGSSGNPIIYGAYGAGVKPIITGADTVTGWTQYSGSIYVADVGNITAPDQLYVDGVYIDIAHYPNSGFLIATADSTDGSSIIDSNLNLSADKIVGSTVMAKSLAYRVIPSTATAYDPSTQKITLDPKLYAGLSAGWGFYLQNKLWMLDSPKEWYYDSTAGKIYLWTASGDDPNNHTVEISKRQYGVYDLGKNYIKIQDLEVGEAASSNIYIRSASGVEVSGLTVSGGLYGIIIRNSSNCSVNNNSIQNTLVDGVDAGTYYQLDAIKNIDILNNTIINAGNIGMPRTSYASIYVGNWVGDWADSVNIKNNTITNSGYIGIMFNGNLINVENNNIDKSCLVFDDCGGIYTSAIQGLDSPELDKTHPSKNSIIGNTVSNTIGNCEGTAYGTKYNCYTITNGIYLDAVAYTTSVLNNTVINADNGIFSNDGHDNIFTGNKVYSVRRQAFQMTSGSFQASQDAGGLVKNNIIKNNLFDSKNASSAVYLQNSAINEAIDFGTFDNNKYCNPGAGNVFATNVKGQPSDPGYNTNNGLTPNFYSLPAWQKVSGQDAHSTESTSSCYGQSAPDPLPSCGDSTCNTGETCSSCPEDCGACITACTPNWQCTDWSACTNYQQTRACTDSSNCGTATSPSTIQSCTANCTPNWQCTDWSACTDSTQKRTCTDSSSCGITSGKPSESQQCVVNCTPNWTCASWSACTNSAQTRTCTDSNKCGLGNGKPSEKQSCTLTKAPAITPTTTKTTATVTAPTTKKSMNCQPSWNCNSRTACVNSKQTITCFDSRGCVPLKITVVPCISAVTPTAPPANQIALATPTQSASPALSTSTATPSPEQANPKTGVWEYVFNFYKNLAEKSLKFVFSIFRSGGK